MREVVTEGTAATADLPGKVGGKTGTAEFGTGDPLPTHAWFIGFRGDLAFAVVVEDGGVGGRVAAPARRPVPQRPLAADLVDVDSQAPARAAGGGLPRRPGPRGRRLRWRCRRRRPAGGPGPAEPRRPP